MARETPDTASPRARSTVSARYLGDIDGNIEWRVRLSVPSTITGSAALAPLGNQMIFPFNPTIIMSQRANYSEIAPTHSNYVFHAYQNSQVDEITITGEFLVENASDAAYWLACVHYLRTMTKMFYGTSDPAGNPPMICRLNGYGKYVLNNIPVVVKNFNVDLPSEVDYIPCEFNGDPNYVPAQSNITVAVAPNYSRRTISNFNLKDFANGDNVRGSEGFI